MKNLTQHLTQYAGYHRNIINIATHFVGIPLIVLGVAALFSRPSIELAGFILSGTIVFAFIASLFYLKLDLWLGLTMTIMMIFCVWFGSKIAELQTMSWLAISMGLFILGWIIQFIGHIYEKKKPAFVDDIMGLAIGPLFVLTEFVFILGLRKELKEKIELESGQTWR